ncbi:hypothetical protein KXW55_008233 [Aspergillus fumigatus]|nr:hypothetical protein KXX42_005829 [Aspergillus fumigatus]KAH3279579.1 hypothetical protein KXW55_008233 [Aspergillus fumigatus]
MEWEVLRGRFSVPALVGSWHWLTMPSLSYLRQCHSSGNSRDGTLTLEVTERWDDEDMFADDLSIFSR